MEENKYTFENPEYRHTYWHTCSHIMAQAIKRLWPEVQLTIGPAIAEGWYYDIYAPFAFTSRRSRRRCARSARKSSRSSALSCRVPRHWSL